MDETLNKLSQEQIIAQRIDKLIEGSDDLDFISQIALAIPEKTIPHISFQTVGTMIAVMQKIEGDIPQNKDFSDRKVGLTVTLQERLADARDRGNQDQIDSISGIFKSLGIPCDY